MRKVYKCKFVHYLSSGVCSRYISRSQFYFKNACGPHYTEEIFSGRNFLNTITVINIKVLF